jgi:hypothetical protein
LVSRKGSEPGAQPAGVEQALRENLFYKLLGRKPPEPRPLGPKRAAPKIRPGEFDNDPAYQELLGKVKKIFDDAEAKGVQIRNRREDILNCANCGAFEDVLCGEESRRTFLSKGEETDKPFLVIDAKETTEHYEHGNRSVMEHQYVCGACGVHQSASFTPLKRPTDLRLYTCQLAELPAEADQFRNPGAEWVDLGFYVRRCFFQGKRRPARIRGNRPIGHLAQPASPG